MLPNGTGGDDDDGEELVLVVFLSSRFKSRVEMVEMTPQLV